MYVCVSWVDRREGIHGRRVYSYFPTVICCLDLDGVRCLRLLEDGEDQNRQHILEVISLPNIQVFILIPLKILMRSGYPLQNYLGLIT